MTTTLCHGSAGWYVEWFQEDAIGYRTAYWYGSREACVARMPLAGMRYEAE